MATQRTRRILGWFARGPASVAGNKPTALSAAVTGCRLAARCSLSPAGRGRGEGARAVRSEPPHPHPLPSGAREPYVPASRSETFASRRHRNCPPSPPLEQFVEPLLPFVLFVGGQQYGDDFLLVDRGDDAGRVGFDVGAGRDAAEFGEEGLRLLAEQEVCRQERGVRMRRLGAD